MVALLPLGLASGAIRLWAGGAEVPGPGRWASQAVFTVHGASWGPEDGAPGRRGCVRQTQREFAPFPSRHCCLSSTCRAPERQSAPHLLPSGKAAPGGATAPGNLRGLSAQGWVETRGWHLVVG